MEREVALARLRPLEQRLRQQGVTALYLFGSTARDEAGDDSDIDLLFDYDPETKFSLFDQAGVYLDIKETLERDVDLVSRRGLRPSFKAKVEPEMVQVF
ncbi:MAG: DNA polymerase III subunit beta [Sphingomonadales bacterium]|nr:MAG: DNA polymerase III subunit beta [Sphingomonadales bacterium]